MNGPIPAVPSPEDLKRRIQALAQHEVAHYVVATALGFEGEKLTLQVQLDAHRGKSTVDCVVSCGSLSELRSFMRKRAVVILAGAMGEALDRASFEVDGRRAHLLLSEGDTGAGQDNAVAKEIAQLLDNSSMADGGERTPSRDVFVGLLADAFSIVQINARPICELADMLAARVTSPFSEAVLLRGEIESTTAFKAIQRVQL